MTKVPALLGPPRGSSARQQITGRLNNGSVIVGSDAHYWPGKPSTAHRAFVRLARDLQPDAVVMNGDAVDAPRISRWSPGDWQNMRRQPKVVDELEAARERLSEILEASPRATHVWTLGNHDARFERYIIDRAPELIGVPGTSLRDHFEGWIPCWSLVVEGTRGDVVMIKHRFRGGTHAAHNNTLHAGVSVVTGHLHSLKISPYSDYRGTRYGVDTGTLAVPYDDQFIDYTEDNPVNWRSGFVVLTFEDGRLLWPEPVFVIDEAAGLVCFRGQLIEV